MSEVETISTRESVLTNCPVFVRSIDDPDGYEYCAKPLEVIATRYIVGDDYGSWEHVFVDLRCGHTLKQMQDSIKHEAEA